MNRRGFLKALSGAAAAAVLPISWALRAPELKIVKDQSAFATASLTMSLDDFSRKYIEPAMKHMARKIDEDIYRLGVA